MKSNHASISAHRLIGLFLAIALMTTACEKYSDNIYPNPEISLEGSDYREIRRGEPIDVTFNLQAEGGNKELIVFQNGALLDRVPLPADATTYTYTGQHVPEDASEGEEFTYQFWLVNADNYPSERVNLTVSTIAYETITIGETALYEVEIPEDGIIEAGTTYRFVSGRNYYINRFMRFQSGASLEIQAGVHLYLDPDASPVVDIEIADGASVEMIGTAEAPIIITSANTLTSGGEPDDWGQLNLRMTDGSGEVQYVRLEYGGERTLRIQDVVAPTIIQYIQVYKPGAGEGIMVTNGNVNLKYIVATDCQDGSFRLGDAYAGSLQFAIATTSEADDADEFTVRETASPTISNITVLGPGTNVSNTHGIRLRANSSAKIYNSIIAEFPRRGLRLNDNVQVTDLNGQTVFAHSFIFNVPTDPYRDDTDQGNPFRGYIDGSGNLQNPFLNNIEGFSGNNPILTIIPGIGVHDFVPDAEQTSAFNPTSLGPFFSSAAFVGAVQNAENDWTRGWVKNPDGTVR